jgi:hypothetical protein
MSDAGKSIEQRIRDRAYQLWEHDGRQEGRSHEYWERARTEREPSSEATVEQSVGEATENLAKTVTGTPDATPAPSVRGLSGSLSTS